MADQTAVIPVPVRTPLFKGAGNLDRTWILFFEQLLKLLNQSSSSSSTGGGTTTTTGLIPVHEVPTGPINGSNVSFQLSYVPVNGWLVLMLANSLQSSETVDYTLTGNVITLNSAPEVGDTLKAWYFSGDAPAGTVPLAHPVSGYKHRVYLATLSPATWTVPSTWDPANNRVECIGGGGGGDGGQASGGGGGGGYGSKQNLALTPGSAMSYQVGAGGHFANGGDTWFGGSNIGTCLVGAHGGARGLGGAGGAGGTGIGTLTYQGGDGGSASGLNFQGSGGGGGAAGPNGPGGSGGSAPGVTGNGGGGGGNSGGSDGSNSQPNPSYAAGNGGAGGGGAAGSFPVGAQGGQTADADGTAGTQGGGGGGGSYNYGGGADGGSGSEWATNVGSGGGGGGCGAFPNVRGVGGGAGGLYGGGSGGTGTFGAARFGAPGIIVISWGV